MNCIYDQKTKKPTISDDGAESAHVRRRMEMRWMESDMVTNESTTTMDNRMICARVHCGLLLVFLVLAFAGVDLLNIKETVFRKITKQF
eukprot:scaffold4510_cov183-Amphora_coffeaeformis.AAC.110